MELPQELWMRISELACVDDGSTGRSLSLVSRRLHAASEAYRDRSVAIRGTLQLARFVRYLEERPEGQPAHVNFLFISTDSEDNADADMPLLQEFYKPNVCDRKPGPEPQDILADFGELVVHAIMRVLTLVASTVRILHICMPLYRDLIFFPVPMDRLEEMTLEGPFESGFEDFIPSLPRIPTLRRLKLTHPDAMFPWNSFRHSTLIPSITKLAPHLTHLYLEQESNAGRTIRALKDLLHPPPQQPTGNSENKQSSNEERPTFPRTLEKLFLHPGMAPPPMRCGTGLYRMISEKAALEKFYFSEPKIVYFEPYPLDSRSPEGKEEAEKEWLDRSNGGEGAWDESLRMRKPRYGFVTTVLGGDTSSGMGLWE
ncbi:hypothetical protein CC2G_011613 [Coprinopsis cinerea AmutBmut pab1-1]|nr:hypothetical protein CC2G_011613 [Coprinopsis cinerea AmutBmut pab1-1]